MGSGMYLSERCLPGGIVSHDVGDGAVVCNGNVTGVGNPSPEVELLELPLSLTCDMRCTLGAYI